MTKERKPRFRMSFPFILKALPIKSKGFEVSLFHGIFHDSGDGNVLRNGEDEIVQNIKQAEVKGSYKAEIKT